MLEKLNVLKYTPLWLFAVRSWFRDTVFRRIFANAGLLLSGKTVTGFLGLGYISLSAHGLGLHDFGLLVLVQTYVQVIVGLTTFHSWQAVIRYGTISLEQSDNVAFQKLIQFTSLLDVVGVCIGFVIAWFIAPFLGPYLGWNDQIISYAQFYSILILFTIVATPTGLLRLYDRFDILAWQVTIIPGLRLIGVGLAVYFDKPIWAYLLAWFVAGVLGGLILVFLGWREGFTRGNLRQMSLSMRGVIRTNRGIVGFCFASNFHSSLQIVTGHMATLLVGLLVTPGAAGLYKAGREVATALTKPAELLTQSIYPEFARLGATGNWTAVWALIRRAETLSAIVGIAIFLGVFSFGQPFLMFFFGADFAQAYAVLVLLVAAASITIAGFGFDPALYAMGLPSVSLRVNALAVFLVYLPALVVLTQMYQEVGAGIAMLLSSTVMMGTLGIWTWIELKRPM